MTTTINGRTPEEITYNCMMYRLKRPNEWDEHCAGSLTLKGRVETAKWAYNYIQQLERERDAAVEDLETMGEARAYCDTCLHNNTNHKEEPCSSCMSGYLINNWQWRGAEVE